MVEIMEGEAFVGGITAETAASLLRRAEAADMDPSVVRVTAGGFIVPEAIAEEDAEPEDEAEPEGKTEEKAEPEDEADSIEPDETTSDVVADKPQRRQKESSK